MDSKKKKTLILGLLVVAMLAIGAYQFVGSDDSAKPKPTPAGGETPSQPTVEETPQPAESDVDLAMLKRKDPFAPGSLPMDESTAPTVRQPRQTPPSPGTLRSGFSGQVLPPVVPTGQPTPEPPKETFDYTLVGVVEGPIPIAVFKSSSGAQTMVRIGGAVGQNGRVTGIHNGRVTVLCNGKTSTLQVGGNSQ